MGYVVLMFVTRKPGMSFEAFVDHYENKHIPLVLEIIGDDAPVRHTRHYVRSNPGSAEGSDVHSPPATTDFDCLTTVEFRDEAHFHRVFANSRRKQELEDDQAAFSDKTKFRAVAVEDPKVTVP
ncbi:hypothetical protein C7974DRAFT_154673 [Boeremia exigua]|uniref:uncharacterized protein n=1 Tax=Boeremia exigua TaxID=749465 RepID=UPI001E8DA99F|nr:uncharacterized protein C7974DRAFT_154673 [Boeremia exigua]KAH6638118.1 hypothetical protein C7974DRAFT_154673 [Boeremia exigua]